MEKTLIFEDEKLLNSILADLSQYTTLLRKLKTAYEALELGAFNDEVFASFKQHRTKEIIARYEQNLEDQLDKSGIKNTNLRRVALEGAELPKIELNEAFEALKSFYVQVSPYAPHRNKTLALKEICYQDGAFKVENVEEITEKYCRVYLTDETDKEIYDTLIKTKEALNEFSLMAKKFGFPFSFGDTRLNSFFTNTDEKIEIRPYSIEMAKTHLPNLKAYNDAQEARVKKQSDFQRAQAIKAGLM